MLFLLRNIMFNTANWISCLCEWITKGHLPSIMPILYLLLLLQSHSLWSLSFVSVHLFCFNSYIHQVVWIPFHCLLFFWKWFFPVLWVLLNFMFWSISCCFLLSYIISAYHWLEITLKHVKKKIEKSFNPPYSIQSVQAKKALKAPCKHFWKWWLIECR